MSDIDDDDPVAFGQQALLSLFDNGGDLPSLAHGFGATTEGPAKLLADEAVEPCSFHNVAGTGGATTVRMMDLAKVRSGGLTLCVPQVGGSLKWCKDVGDSSCVFLLKGIGDGGKPLAVGGVFTLRPEGCNGGVVCTQQSLASGELELICLPAKDVDGNEAWFTVDGIVDSDLNFDEVSGAEPTREAAAAAENGDDSSEDSGMGQPLAAVAADEAIRRARALSSSKKPGGASQQATSEGSVASHSASEVPGASGAGANVFDDQFTCDFGDGPLGVTLRLSPSGFVEFSGVLPEGQAAEAGMQDGDVLLELQGDEMVGVKFDEVSWAALIARVRTAPRPLHVKVGRPVAAGKEVAAEPALQAPSKPLPPISANARPSLLRSLSNPTKSSTSVNRGTPQKQCIIRVHRPTALWANFQWRQLMIFPEEIVLRACAPPQAGGAGGAGGLGSCVSDAANRKTDSPDTGSVAATDGAGALGNGQGGGVAALLAAVDEEDTVMPLATVKVRLPRPAATLSPTRRDPALQHSFELLSPFGSMTLCFQTTSEKADWVAALQQAVTVALDGMVAQFSLGSHHQVVLGTLHSAVACGDTTLAMELLSSGADPNALDSDGLSATQLASALWQHSLLNALCQRDGSATAPVKSASGRAVELNNLSPLHLACRRATAGAPRAKVTSDLTATVGVLLRAGAHPNAVDPSGETALDLLLLTASDDGTDAPPELGRTVEAFVAAGARCTGKSEAAAVKVAGKPVFEAATKAWKATSLIDVSKSAVRALGPESWSTPEGTAGPEEAASCVACGAAFTVFRREHHCRVCGARVCGACSSKNALLAGISEPARACDGCFNRLRASQAAGGRAAPVQAAPSSARAAATAALSGESRQKQELFGGRAGSAGGAGEKEKKAGNAAAGAAADTRNVTEQLKNDLSQRGEALANMADKSDQLLDSASRFEAMARELNKKERSWW